MEDRLEKILQTFAGPLRSEVHRAKIEEPRISRAHLREMPVQGANEAKRREVYF